MSIVPFPKPSLPPEGPHPGFSSFKCRSPVFYNRRSCRDALIQATLDADISAIESLPSANYESDDAYFGFVAVISGLRCAVILTDHSESTPKTPCGCDVAISLSRDALLSDPVRTVSRMIWSHRDTLVPAGFIVRVMNRLPSGPNGVRLADLEDDLLDEPRRWVEFILAMASTGLVTLDYRSHVTGDTLIRRRVSEVSQAPKPWAHLSQVVLV